MSQDKPEAYVTAQNLKSKTKTWLAAIADVNKHKMRLRAGKSALLVIDMQRFFADPGGAAYLPCTRAIMPNVKLLIEAFRRARRPVIYTRHVHHPELLDAGIMGWWWKEMCVEGTLDSEVCPEIAPRESDKVVTKHRYSAFFDTDLETILRTLKIEDLALCGVMTNMCCESTARDAYYRDYWTFFPADATGTASEEMHQASLLNLAYGFACVTSTDDLISQLALVK